MCEVTLKIDENQVRKANPSLTDTEAITRWVQHLVDARIAEMSGRKHRKEAKPVVKKEFYTPDEAYELIMKDVKAIYQDAV